MRKSILLLTVTGICQLHASGTHAQPLKGYIFRIVNMIPHNQSNETLPNDDATVAVNRANPEIIAGSAFTFNPTNPTGPNPLYISTDRGNTWALNMILPDSASPADNSLAFASSSGILYAGSLEDEIHNNFITLNVLLRTGDPTSSAIMTGLEGRSSQHDDLSFIAATTVAGHDRVFAGHNFLPNSIWYSGDGKTAEVMASNAAEGPPPAGFSNDIIEKRGANPQDLPAVRTAVHPSGVVYAAFYRWLNSGNPDTARCDVIVVRDDNFAMGATPFSALIDGSDGMAGMKVDSNVYVPALGPWWGSSGASLAIAVDPNNPANVFVAMCDSIVATGYTLHVRQSSNSGLSWSSDLLTVANCFNPGIAVTTDGKVGVVYQQVTGSYPNDNCETHFQLSSLGGTSFTDDILSTYARTDIDGSDFFGEYIGLEAVGTSFFGIFAAGNLPIPSHFPHNVKYQRNANFNTGQLLDITNTKPVAASADPFFFEIAPDILFDLCAKDPKLCPIKIFPPYLNLPPYPCLICPWPCLTCPPFNVSMGDIYESVYKKAPPETVLQVPYFHLFLEGSDLDEYSIQITTGDGVPISQELDKTAGGYAISFLPSRNYYDRKQGLHGLQVAVLPKTEAAAKRGLKVKYRLEASDYRAIH